jgi:hypothetical protein
VSRWRPAVFVGKTARRFIRGLSRWRLAVFAGTIARRSESLRMRLGRRLPAAFGGCLRSRAGPPAGSTVRGRCGRTQRAAARNGSALLPRSVRGRASLLAGARCLWSPSVLGSSPRQRLTEAARSGGSFSPIVVLCSGSHAAYAGLAQAGRAGGVRPNGTGPKQQRCGLIPPDRSASVRRIRGVGPRTLRDHKQQPALNNPTQLRAERMLLKEPNRCGPPPTNPTAASPHAVVPAGGRPLTSGTHQTRPPAARPNACAVTRTHARSCSRKPPAANATSGLQPNCATSEVI